MIKDIEQKKNDQSSSHIESPDNIKNEQSNQNKQEEEENKNE